MQEGVCAIVVSFHPDAEIVQNLEALRPQVAAVVVVDNGSPAADLTLLRKTATRLDLNLVENGENLGIATALNVGVRWAKARGFAWVLLFDQDSCVTDGMASTLVAAFETSPWGAKLGILVPSYVDRRMQAALQVVRVRGGGLESVMTSGSLMRTSIFDLCGYFIDELFIDAVDFEYCLRLRKRGFVIDECRDALLLHSPGTPTVVRFRGRRLFQTANYSPLRLYYQTRNKIWVTRHYFWNFPGFCLKLFYYVVKESTKIALGESNRKKKLRYTWMGIRDGLGGRMGKLNEK